MTWVCARCGTPANGASFDPWCPACQDKTIAIQASPITYIQYREISDLFTSMGEINRNRRMRRLAAITGRLVRDYRDLTSSDAAMAIGALKEEARAK